MNCVKSVSIEQEIGKGRMWFLSIAMTLAYFMIFYTVFSTFVVNAPMIDHGFFVLTVALLLTLPLHSFLHCLPIWLVGKKATFGLKRNHWPYFCYSTRQPLSKQISLIATISPALFITAGSILAAIMFPQYLHYISMVSALNFGLCLHDFFTFKQISSAPSESVIEENQRGFYVLIKGQE
ncbi:DUF3267 domain-containing protein [Paenalkalicoccus suaedae]|uniref:DUF3267 domain-containing protein n=1 Tax=Paenalkalicoccus suaedae TaxID=2592382 RepID=A0A859FCF5_9BACI|nr:DUF3267 domain-containing protein [Paenalkalicoccus suaedae]QKS70747.1 DUF3267 domain-containing protein [Paenalkalicoccus suaedae]